MGIMSWYNHERSRNSEVQAKDRGAAALGEHVLVRDTDRFFSRLQPRVQVALCQLPVTSFSPRWPLPRPQCGPR